MNIDIVSILISVFGIIVVIAALRLKLTGKVTEFIMLPRKSTSEQILDKAAFTVYMFPRTLIFGIYTFAFGFSDYAIVTLGISTMFSLLFTGIFIVLVILYVNWLNHVAVNFLDNN